MINKAAKIGMLVWTCFCFFGSCYGIMNVSQHTQGRELGGAEAAGVGIGMFMWMVLWAIPMVVMGIVALVSRPKPQVQIAAAASIPASLCQHCGKYYQGQATFCPLCGKTQVTV
jgi:hypothetical protein